MKKSTIDYGPVGGVLYTPESGLANYEPISWHHGLGGAHDRDGVGKQMANGMDVDRMVFCFQNRDQNNWSKGEILACSEYIRKFTDWKVNVVGYSQGGQGVAAWLNYCRDRVLTAGFIAGWTNLANYQDFVNIPMRAWHDADDDVVTIGAIKRFIESVAAAGGDATSVFWPKDGIGGHGIVGKATDPNDPEAYWQWLASKKKPIEPELEDPIDRQYYLGGKIHFVGASGKTYTLEIRSEN